MSQLALLKESKTTDSNLCRRYVEPIQLLACLYFHVTFGDLPFGNYHVAHMSLANKEMNIGLLEGSMGTGGFLESGGSPACTGSFLLT